MTLHKHTTGYDKAPNGGITEADRLGLVQEYYFSRKGK